MRPKLLAAATAAASVAAGFAFEHRAVQRRRREDPEAAERFGIRRGDRHRFHDLEDGGRIFVEETGPARSRRAIVFTTGSALRTDQWHYQMAGLGGHRALFYDLRGHGRSRPKGDVDYTMAQLAGDLHELLQREGLEEVVLVGHSIGGMISLQLCESHPDLLGGVVKGLVLLNTTPHPPAESILGGIQVARIERITRRPIDALAGLGTGFDTLRRFVRPSDAVFWGVALAAFGPGASASQIDLTYEMVSETPSDVIFDLLKCYRSYDMVDRLSAVNVPAVVVAGTHDRLTVADASDALAQGLPKAELILLEGCGHMSMLERHRQVNDIIVRLADDTLGKVKQRKAEDKR